MILGHKRRGRRRITIYSELLNKDPDSSPLDKPVRTVRSEDRHIRTAVAVVVRWTGCRRRLSQVPVLRSSVYRTKADATGISAVAPKPTIVVPAVDRWIYHVAADGRKTVRSNFPSPS